MSLKCGSYIPTKMTRSSVASIILGHSEMATGTTVGLLGVSNSMPSLLIPDVNSSCFGCEPASPLGYNLKPTASAPVYARLPANKSFRSQGARSDAPDGDGPLADELARVLLVALLLAVLEVRAGVRLEQAVAAAEAAAAEGTVADDALRLRLAPVLGGGGVLFVVAEGLADGHRGRSRADREVWWSGAECVESWLQRGVEDDRR